MNYNRFKKKIDKALLKLSGEKLPNSIVRAFNSCFRNSGIRFRSERYDQEFNPSDCVIVSGYFYTFLRSNAIEIVLGFPKEKKKVQLGAKEQENLGHRILQTIVHEYRHKQQASKKSKMRAKSYRAKTEDFELEYYLEYFGNRDEIDAHAYETLIDFDSGRMNINRLRKPSKITMAQSEAIWLYRKYFMRKDPKIWNRFLKKVYKNYARIYGIPQRTRSQISCG